MPGTKSKDRQLSHYIKKSALETMLLDNGFECPERDKFDKRAEATATDRVHKIVLPRFKYKGVGWNVLTESEETPFWTIQKVINKRVVWFIDIPQEVGMANVFLAMGALE